MASCRCLAGGLAWDRAQLDAFRNHQLRALVRHAYERVPYYRRRFEEAGLRPEHIRTLADLSRIPPTSRSDLQSRPAGDVVARGLDPERLCLHRTGGSSGQPLNIRRSWFEDRLLQAWRLRVMGLHGLRVFDRRAAVVTSRGAGHPLYARLGLLRYEEIHNLWPPERILASIREIRPDVLRGYPSTLSWLTGLMGAKDRREIRPRFVTTDSETMTPDMRARIQAGFRAPVYDFYDSHEFNLIAWECPRRGLYQVSEATVILEVLNQDGREAEPGEAGEVVGTALHSWAMPFLRYRLGDVAVKAESGMLARVEGRLVERFRLPDGSSLHPYALVSPLVRQAPWLRRFQIVQEEAGLVTVRLVPMENSAPSPDSLAGTARELELLLGGEVRVRAQLVDEIAPGANGKYRPYYTLVSPASFRTPRRSRQ